MITPEQTELLELADLVLKQAEVFGDALLKALPAVATKPCPRCDGQGFATVFSKERAHWTGDALSKVCFRCSGSGTLPATRLDAAVLRAAHTEQNAERLRVKYRGQCMAISILEAALALGHHWAIAHSVKVEIARRVHTVEAGRIEAAEAKRARDQLAAITSKKSVA